MRFPLIIHICRIQFDVGISVRQLYATNLYMGGFSGAELSTANYVLRTPY